MDESLPSNLFPVLALPEFIHGDDTPVRRMGGDPFRSLFAGSSPRPAPEKVSDWLADPDRARALVGMLNAALREHCYHLRIRTPKEDRTHFYCPIFDEQPRTFRWGTTGRERTLAKLKARPNGTTFGVHMSAKMRFVTIGPRLFLLVEPGWLFTSDGSTPLQGPEVGRYSTMWSGPERNATVLRNVLMWGLLLSRGSSRIEIGVGGAASIAVQSVPAHTQIKAGLEGDSIRLDRILGGEGAGETAPAAMGGPAGTASVSAATDTGADELDHVADLALVGGLDAAIVDDAERRGDDDEDAEPAGDDGADGATAHDAASPYADDPEDTHGATGPERGVSDNSERQRAELELPF